MELCQGPLMSLVSPIPPELLPTFAVSQVPPLWALRTAALQLFAALSSAALKSQASSSCK